MILETAVGCARVCCDRPTRQGRTTQWASDHKAEQRGMASRAQCNRAHSELTHWVNIIEGKNLNIHNELPGLSRGQLPFLG